MAEVLERARRYIAKCPVAVSGQGGHDATFHVAAVLVWGFALGETEALMLLREWNQSCLPPWSESELAHKVRSAGSAPHRDARGYLLGDGVPRPKPNAVPQERAGPARVVDPVAATESFLKGFRCGEPELFEASPAKPGEDPRFDGAVLLDALYAPGELINIVTEHAVSVEKGGVFKARPVGKGITLERDALSARFRTYGSDSDRGGAWLRMNPLDGNGIADTNVTAFRFALLESDKLPLELQLSLFAKLPVPVAAILGSGGRSVHAWVKVEAANIEDYRSTVARLLELLARFGVDGKNKNPSRLSRLPGARREIGAADDGFQRLIYLNPEPAERSIF
jgi:hypothetical protein